MRCHVTRNGAKITAKQQKMQHTDINNMTRSKSFSNFAARTMKRTSSSSSLQAAAVSTIPKVKSLSSLSTTAPLVQSQISTPEQDERHIELLTFNKALMSPTCYVEYSGSPEDIAACLETPITEEQCRDAEEELEIALEELRLKGVCDRRRPMH